MKPQGWRVFVILGNHDFHAVGRQHFERAGKRRFGKGVRVNAEKQRAVDALLLAIAANSLTNGKDMPFVEALVECRTAMPRGAERDLLPGHRRLRNLRVVGSNQFGYVDQHR